MRAYVYCVRHQASGRCYVGTTTNLKQRWYQHRYLLERGRHHAPRLQLAWTKHGAAAFEFVVLEWCDVSEVAKREQFHLQALRAYDRGYNACPSTERGDPLEQAKRASVRWSDPEQRRLQAERVYALWRRAGFRESHARRASTAQRKRWARPGEREKQAERMRQNNPMKPCSTES